MNRFIGGHNIQQAIKRLQNSHYIPILDYAKEASTSRQDALDYVVRLRKDVNVVKGIQCAFALKYSSFNNDKYMDYVIKYMRPHVSKILLDAEDARYHNDEQRCYSKLLNKYNAQDIVLYKTYQMYRRDGLETLANDIMTHKHLGIKLVRGAYMEKDRNTGKLFMSKQETDASYNGALDMIIKWLPYRKYKLIVATHNDSSLHLATSLMKKYNVGIDKVQFAQLLGMNESASTRLVKNGYVVYKYVPYGSIFEMYPYLIRRLYENFDVARKYT